MTGSRMITGVAAVAMVLAGASCTSKERSNAAKRNTPASTAGGYLAADKLPDVISAVPPPPAAGSPELAKDEAAREEALKAMGTDRYNQAVTDASRSLPDILHGFSCALGTDIDKANTPTLFAMLNKTFIDVRRSISPAKSKYKRPRPFAVHNGSSCLPSDDAMLRIEGSYPGGQSATGWAFGHILATLNPAQSEALLKRGDDFGQSRVICDGQWQSDIDAGRGIGKLILSRLQADPKFQADLKQAQVEVSKALASGSNAPKQCPAAD
jgi:acid phosphatase (class A)